MELGPLILVPAYNEWPHLLEVLEGLRPRFGRILVIDDASEDSAYLRELDRTGFPYVTLPFNLGHWGAVQAGFRYALKKDYLVAVTFDGDGQHFPEEVFKLLSAMEEGFDLAIGARHERGSLLRKTSRSLLRRLSGLPVADFTSGLRAYNRRAMATLLGPEFLSFEYQDLGVLFLARQKGLTMTEVPVAMRDRAGRPSRVFPGPLSTLRYMMVTLLFIMARRP